ncbi:amidotransferase [Pseudomonas sp. NPDC089569]|uniref:amidotransferase n=1 Tax=Pseudomonas sp. NPDC089569 TaxID=3390722 RepID=UPI003D094176
MLSLCILETDHLRPELVDEFHGYGYLFQRLFERQPIPVRCSVFNVVDGHYPADTQTFDAYLITGSKADAFGDAPWIEVLRSYLLQRYQAGDMLLGICFGHQILALVLGGECGRSDRGWGLGVHHYQLLEHKPWMTPTRDGFDLLVSHQDQVSVLPKGAQLLASSPFCPLAAYQVGKQVLCFQGHPEFVEPYAQALLDLRREVYGEDLYGQATASFRQGNDGALIAQWMLQFVTWS